MAKTSEESSLKKGPWTPEEDQKLIDCIEKHGLGSWKRLPILAGLNRCGKSCRLRWTNYLRPDIKRGAFSDEEQLLIIDLHAKLGNKWSAIASYLPGRTDNEIKNFWNTHLKKRLIQNGIDPVTHMQIPHLSSFSPVLPQFLGCTSSGDPTWENAVRYQIDAARLAKILLIGNILQLLNNGTSPRLPMEAFTRSSESAQFTSSIQQGINDIPPPVFQKVVATNSFMEVKNEFGGLSTAHTNYTLPDLVSACPDTDQTQNGAIRPADFSNLSMTFEDLADFMDDESSNYDWKQILDRESFLP